MFDVTTVNFNVRPPPFLRRRKTMFERKYKIKIVDGIGRIVKKENEVPIPEDEPLFIFRAKDRKALCALVAYNMVLDNLDQKAVVTACINDFRLFQEMHPGLMGEPGP
jgi:hypothetical protein